MTNPYLPVFVLPLITFIALAAFGVHPDLISLVARIYAFSVLGYVGARYVGRAPILVWDRNVTPEARNVIGWAVICVGFQLQLAYGWLYISMQRPEWLSSQYWNSGIIVLVSLGLSIVASSVPRFPPFGDGRNGLGEIASIVLVAASAIGLMIVSHFPQVATLIRSLFGGLVRTL